MNAEVISARTRYFDYLIIIIAGFLVFGSTLSFDFAYDDLGVIVSNPNVQSFDKFWETLSLPYWSGEKNANVVYRPISSWSFIINNVMGGRDPNIFHLTNVILHISVGILVFILLLNYGVQHFAALCIALLFLIHPVQSEAVANIVGRTGILATLFMIWGLLVYEKKRPYWMPVFFLLALLSKESAIIFPGLLGIREIFRTNKHSKKTFGIVAIGLSLALIFYFLLRHHATGAFFQGQPTPFIDNPLVGLPFGVRIRTALWVFALYLQKIIWPLNLSADYSFNQISIVGTWWDWHWIPGLVAVIVLFILILNRRIHKFIRIGAGFYLVGFSLTSNLILPITNIMAERFLYFPIIGFLLMVYGGLTSVQLRSRLFQLSTATLICILGFVGYLRSQVWVNNDILFTSLVKSAPNSARANYLFSLTLAGNKYEDQAKFFALRSVHIYPDFYPPYILLSKFYLRTGNVDSASWAIDKANSIYDSEESRRLKSIIGSVQTKLDSLKIQPTQND